MQIKCGVWAIVNALFIPVMVCSVLLAQDNTTPLVRSVQDAGAGPLGGVSVTAMYQWMTYHREVATATAKQCNTIAPNAPASWFDTTEGSVCFAAIGAVAAFPAKAEAK